MKINFYRKYIILFFLAIFAVLAVFSCFHINKISAAGLEVTYPTIQTPQGAETVDQNSDLGHYLKYVFDIGIFIGFFTAFLSLIWAGILYFLSPIPTVNTLAEAKERVSGAISGILILALLYLIITTINPYLAIFNTSKPGSPPPTPPDTQSFGVNFYKSTDCSGTANTNTTSISDVGDSLRNKINSVSIVQSPQQSIYYISLLYDATNFWGKCQYINPNTKCVRVQPFANSASVYQYDFSPSGDGVYLYRESFNEVSGKKADNKKGGYMEITNSQIGKLYNKKLSDLNFMINPNGDSSDPNNCTVPEEDMDCAKYDINGTCIKKQCPNLGGENLTSIKIAGNYLVVLLYENPSDNSNPWWTYCQAYPSLDDVNKDGPQQIKWDAIRVRGYNPQYIEIIPVTAK